MRIKAFSLAGCDVMSWQMHNALSEKPVSFNFRVEEKHFCPDNGGNRIFRNGASNPPNHTTPHTQTLNLNPYNQPLDSHSEQEKSNSNQLAL
jgi:hypothetical protein